MKKYIFAFLNNDVNFKLTGYATLLVIVGVGKYLITGHLG